MGVMPNTERPIWLSTDSPLAAGIAPVTPARNDVPRNITPSRMLMVSIVVWAFFHSGGLNAGTPFATASVPVIAEQPSANARRRSSSPNVSGGTSAGVTPVTWGALPVRVWKMPTPRSSSIDPRKMYVGEAKSVPLSRRPRRLAAITSRIASTINGTVSGKSAGNAEATAWMPDETLTATVRT